MAISTRNQRRNGALKPISDDGVDGHDAATDLRDRLQRALDAAGTGG